MRRFRQLTRMLSIQRVLVKHGLDEIVWRTHLFRPVAWVGRLLAFGRRRQPLGSRLRKALEELGPIFVKFGQALSVRPRSPACRHRGGAREAAGPGAAVRGRAGSGRARSGFRPPRRAGVRRVRTDAAGGGLDRAGARGAPAGRARRRREGLAAERGRADSARRRGPLRARGARGALLGPKRTGFIPSRSSPSSSGRSPSSSISCARRPTPRS